MKSSMKSLLELSNSIYYDMGNYSQLVIDLVQGGEQLFNSEDSKSDDFGALSYDVDCVLEIIDKTRTHDVEALKCLLFILKSKHNAKWDDYFNKLTENND